MLQQTLKVPKHGLFFVFFLEAHSTFDILIPIILLQFVLLDASLENAKPHYHGLLRRY